MSNCKSVLHTCRGCSRLTLPGAQVPQDMGTKEPLESPGPVNGLLARVCQRAWLPLFLDQAHPTLLVVGKMCVNVPQVGRLRRLTSWYKLNCAPNPIHILGPNPKYLRMTVFGDRGL